MSDDIGSVLFQLQQLPEGLHLLCPRTSLEDPSCWFEEDLAKTKDGSSDDDDTKSEREKRIREAKERKELLMRGMIVFTYDGPDALHFQKWLKQRLEDQLQSCDICIREYHRGRKELKSYLEEEYQESDVTTVCNLYDDMDIERIRIGLNHAKKDLLDTEPALRGINAIDKEGTYGIFEAMNCEVFLHNESLLKDVFDNPFHLVQSRKPLKLNGYAPAMTLFLFSNNGERRKWAYTNWLKAKRNITGTEFDWTVREPLKTAIERLQSGTMDTDFLATFWQAVQVMVTKMDKHVMTTHLRSLEKNICNLALENLQVDSVAFSNILNVIKRILEESPNDFWDAMGAVPPSSIVDQVFNNKALERVMLRVDSANAEDMQLLDSCLSWTIPFMASIKVSNQYPACRALTGQLLDRFQNDRYARHSRRITYELGVQFIRDTLDGLAEANEILSSVNFVTIHDVIGLVEQYLPRILIDSETANTDEKRPSLTKDALAIILLALKLDILVLEAERDTINRGKSLQHEPSKSSAAIWKLILQANKNRNILVTSYTLQGARGITGLEMIRTNGKVLSKDQKRFNEALNRFSSYVADLLDTVSDFSSDQLNELLSTQESANGVLAPLFSSELQVQQAAIDLLKTATHQIGRMEAIGSLLEKYYAETLFAITLSIRRVARKRIFTPMNTFLKITKEAIQKMCHQNGLLRSINLSDEQKKATKIFWQSLWQVLGVIFDATEAWSNARPDDKDVFRDFCRDTMEFADDTFEQFAIVASAVSYSNPELSSEDKGNLNRELLQHPKVTMNTMVKWLRLRDDFLISISVSLVSKLLVRLKDASIELTKDTISTIENAVNGATRTNLTRNQQAELLRALEYNLGYGIGTSTDEAKPKAKEQTKLTTPGYLVKSESGAKTQPIDLEKWRATGKAQDDLKKEKGRSGGLEKLLSDTSKTAQAFKARGGLGTQAGPVASKAAQVTKPDKNEYMKKRQAEIEAKKKRDAIAIAAAKKNVEPGLITPMPAAEKGEGMMVSSEEESSEDDEAAAMDRELFGIEPKKKKTANLAAYEEEKKKALARERARGPVKKQRYQRSAREMRARLAPDLSPLHKIILSWDYFHQGDFPPNSHRDDYTMVSSKFRSPQDYKNTFLPLLTLEAWQSFVRAREEDNPRSFEIKVADRSSVDALVEVSTVMTHADNKDINITEGDIVLLSKGRRPTSSSNDPHCLGRVARITRKKDSLDILYKVLPGQPLVSSLAPNSTVFGAKILSVIPLEREYGALVGLEYYDLCTEIVNASPSPLLSYTGKQLDSVIDNYKLNEAQAKAVKSAVDNDAFTLIQGPPGTGKTKTIVAIVGALLTGSIRDKAAAIPRPKQVNHNGFPVKGDGPPPRKMLVCAPSNAAVDELVMRFKEGVKTLDGRFHKISVVRLGRSDAMNANVIDVTLDELVKAKLHTDSGDPSRSSEETSKLMREHQEVSKQLNQARAALGEAERDGKQAPTDVKDNFDTLRRRKAMLSNKIDSARDSEGLAHRAADINRKHAQQAVLDEADILCATLSGSGHEMFQNLNIEFETVVVDEAAQCVEMSALIPLKYGCAKCVLVGDPKQLPPTVFSREAARFQYEQSLFARMANNSAKDVHLLNVQYRMHPDIAAFPSATFYDGRLLNGDRLNDLRTRRWHLEPLLSYYRFFDVSGQHTTSAKGHSLINVAEIDAAMQLFDHLVKHWGNSFESENLSKLGIITPYKSQLREFRDRFSRRYGQRIHEFIEFNTTDAFQGRECDIIIFSCVRASPAGGVGFLQDIRRMNVGLTRAKCSLWVLGNAASLSRGEYWKKLVENAKARNVFTDASTFDSALKRSNNEAHRREITFPPMAGKMTLNNIKPPRNVNTPVPQTMDKNSDVDMDRRSSPGDSRSSTPALTTTSKKRRASGTSDVSMEDAPASDPASGKESSVTKSRSATPVSGPARPGGANQMVRKRATGNNPLLAPKRARN
ncbi:MAG: DEAD-box type RNA helicase [Bathelium mastoideum]|nr:MAG: DEAD-box type RNA helicase [Bathelium mastoideum]